MSEIILLTIFSKKSGIKIHPIPSSELSRGRGGPRCMAMPLVRENLNKKS